MQNIAILAGHVGSSPEIRTSTQGTAIASFALATSRPKRDSEGQVVKDDDGYRVEETEWHRIVCFNGLANTVGQFVAKGMKVMVRGRIHYTSWTDQENIKRFGTEIIAEDITFLSRGPRGNDDQPGREHV